MAREAQEVVTAAVVKAAQIATAERVLEELTILGLSDIGDYYSSTGTLLNLTEIDPRARRAIVALKSSKYNKPGAKDGVQEDALELKLADKLEALRDLGRYHKLFTDKLEASDTTPLREKVNRARARLAKARK